VIIAGWAGEYLADVVLGTWSVKYDLPLQLTDVISVVSAFALWTRRRRLVELCYLWAMTATLQAVLTPDLDHGFPSVFYFTYFTYHVGAIVGACLLVFGERLYLQRGAVLRGTGADVFSDPSVWSVTCFVVRKGYRKRGITYALAAAAVGYARENGARALEGYAMRTQPGKEITWGELHVGAVQVFADAGFTEVSSPSVRRAVMRIDFAG